MPLSPSCCHHLLSTSPWASDSSLPPRDDHEADHFSLFGCAKHVGSRTQGNKERAFCTDRRDLVTRNFLVDRTGRFVEIYPTPERD